MAEDHSSSVEIVASEDGQLQRLSIRGSAVTQLVTERRGSWDRPILLHGADAAADIEALMTQVPGQWAHVRSFRDLARILRQGRAYEEIELRLDGRFYEQLAHNARSRLADILAGREHLNSLINFVLRGPSGEGRLSRPFLGDDFIGDVELICNTGGIVIPWQMRTSLLPAFLLAVWSRHSRGFPLIIYSNRKVAVPCNDAIELPASTISFESLLNEITRVYSFSRLEVEQAYRVWQLSRTDDGGGKSAATTPRAIALDTARSFLVVLSKTNTKAPPNKGALQKPAPLIFELDGNSVDLKEGISALDATTIIQASARSFQRRVTRIKADTSLGNLVPTAIEILVLAEDILAKVAAGEASDGDIIELALDFNALQWHIDAVRAHFSEFTIGELTGLFATANLFFSRFPVWSEYTGSALPSGSAEDGVAAFQIAHQLLKNAHEQSAFLTSEATQRIDQILARTSPEEAAPDLREGIVRSSENLAAVTASGLSEVVKREATKFGGEVKDKAYKEGSEAIVSFAKSSAPLLLRLGELRNWPWAKWLHDLLPPPT